MSDDSGYGCLFYAGGFFILVALYYVIQLFFFVDGFFDSLGTIVTVIFFGGLGLFFFFLGGLFAVGEAACDAAGEAIKAIGEIIECVIDEIVSLFSVSQEVRRQCPAALKVQIMAKKANAVDVGIFNGNTITQQMTIRSDYGVADDLYQGQVIAL